MAQDSPASQSTDDLIAAISRNRAELVVHREALHHAAHVGNRLQRTYHDHAGLFLGAAAVLGGLLSLLPFGRKSRMEKRASQRAAIVVESAKRKDSRSITAVILGLLGKLALDMGKPILLKVVRDHYAAAVPRAQPANPPEAHGPQG
jgi:hypothetical protein